MSDAVSFFELVADAAVFNSAFDHAKAKVAEFGAQWEKTAAQVNVSADVMQRAAVKTDTAAGPRAGAGASGLAGGGGLALIGLQAAAYGALALAAAGTAVLAITQRLVENYAGFSAQILRNSEALNMNAGDLQTWEKIAGIVGIDQQSLVMDFERFSKNLADGAPQLKATGLSLQALGITSSDAGTAVLQLADYFHTHSDASQKAAIATALFGRAGAELIPILDQGSAAVQKYKDQLQAMGAILDQNQLIRGAQAQAALTEMTTSFQVAERELAGAALPGFTVFFQTLSVIMQNNASLWVQIGDTIGNVVLFISGLVAGLAGVDLSTILAPPKDAGSAYEGLGGSAQDAAAGIDSATAAAQRATQAIDDQIAALQEQKRAQDEVYDAEKQALQDQLDSLRDVTDSRRHQGEDIVSYERRLQEIGLQDKIHAITDAKSTYDRQADDHIAALEREKAAVKGAAGTMAGDLAAGGAAGALRLNQALSAGLSEAQAKILKWSHDVGQDLSWLFSPDTTKAEAGWRDLGAKIGDGLIQGLVMAIASADYTEAVVLGNFVKGIADTIGSSLTGHAEGTISTQQHLAWISEGNQPEAVLPLTSPSRSLAIMEQTGLATLARGAGGSGGGGSSQPSIVVNFNGPVADELVASRVVARIDKQMRQRGFSQSRGRG